MTGFAPRSLKSAEPWRRRLIRSLLYGRNVDRAAKARARVGFAIVAFAAIIHLSNNLGYILPAIIGLESMGIPSPGETALVLAAEHRLASIAFPAISTGIYRFPAARAARVAVGTATAEIARAPGIKRVVFCCFSPDAAAHHRDAFAALGLG